jgi:phage baseplate assembly protein W
MTLLTDLIDAQLPEIERAMPAPAAPFGYGQDLSCYSDLESDMSSVDPSSKLALSQAIVRRVSTPRGSVVDAPGYGIDLRSYLSRGVDADDYRDVEGQIVAELRQDDRISYVEATVVYTGSTSTLRVTIQVTPVDPAIGVFSLTLAVTDGAELLAEVRS